MPRTPPAGVEVTSPAPRELWWELIERDDGALVTQTPTWLDCLCDARPLADASRLYRFDGGRQVLVPLVRRRGWATRMLAEESWPGWGVGGAVVPDGPPDPQEARLVFEDLADRPALRVAVRFDPRSAAVWNATVPDAFAAFDRTTYLLDLEGGFEEVWAHSFRPQVRRGVRQAERAEVQVEVGRGGRLVPQFRRLHQESVARWAEQQHEPLALARWRHRREEPPRLLEAVAERFGASCAIWLASCGGEPAAAIVVLRHGTHTKYWRGAMDRRLAHPVHANHLLHRLAVEDACAAGSLVYDMGDARPDSSLAAFKQSFGARPVSSPAYYRERLPLTAADRRLRGVVKRAIGFRDA
ncbi:MULTISPECIES: GNAT family N-acetyltransferase [unclassified Kitasatospora]|uniref:GNAT family N-acetyltransferase n=1 Tax=unclassified Kitasatospora TaxID=2633591 RepID=UPI00340784EF